MAKTFVLHDESVNTYGFRMLTEGCDLEEFKRNPVMFYNHDCYAPPIGRWENIRIEDGKILADAVFDDEHDPLAKQIAGKVERNMLRMASIGAWPPEEVSDALELKLPGQTGPTITRWTVREASICAIGANHNALALYDRSGARIDLGDETKIVALMDIARGGSEDERINLTDNKPINVINPKTMSKLIKLLNLADGASQDQVDASVEALIAERDRLQAEADARAQADKAAQEAEAVSLVDEAIKDGRIDASGKSAYIKLFSMDHEAAKASLAALPRRNPVAEQIETDPQPELSDTRTPWQKEMDRVRAARNK